MDETPAILDADPADRFERAITLGGTCFPIFGVFRTEMLKRSTLHRSYYGSDRALIAEAALMGKLLRVDEAVFYNREHPKRSIRMVDHAERRSLAGYLGQPQGRDGACEPVPAPVRDRRPPPRRGRAVAGAREGAAPRRAASAGGAHVA